jgi:hypothetical protein
MAKEGDEGCEVNGKTRKYNKKVESKESNYTK